MFESVKEINKTNSNLIEMENTWYNTVAKDYVEKYNNKYLTKQLSLPFYPGLSLNCVGKKIVMIVGQETRNHGLYQKYDKKWQNSSLEVINWAIETTEKNISSQNGRSHFWNCVRDVYKCGLFPYWTNIDKFHKYNKEYTVALTGKQEVKFNEAFLFNGKKQSIIQHEIDIVQPDLIVFLTGNDYCKTMAKALYNENKSYLIEKAPDFDKKKFVCLNIKNNILTLWTHHPRTMQREKLNTNGNWGGIIDEIKLYLKNKSKIYLNANKN